MKDGVDRLKGESPTLPFSRLDEHDANNKTIKPKVPAYLDIMAAHATKGVILLFKGQQNATVEWRKLFRDPGEYLLHIVINSADCAPCEFDIIFKWTLDPETSSFIV